MKKVLSLLLAMLMLVSLVACGNTTPDTADGSTKLTALIWYQDEGRKAIYDGYLKNYKEQFPDRRK